MISKKKSPRFTIGKMYQKYKLLAKQNYEQVIINEVLMDLHRVISERRIKSEDL